MPNTKPPTPVTFYAIRNLRCFDTLEMSEPWRHDVSRTPWQLEKPAFKKWLETPTTDHRLISLCCGAVPGLRITEDNPVASVAGFIADYDGVVPGDFMEIASDPRRAPNGFLPAYAVATKSNQLRLVWLFQAPFRVCDTEHASRLLTYVGDRLQVRKWFAGYDLKSESPNIYFCVGRSWSPVSEYRLSSELVVKWDLEVFRRRLSQQRAREKSVKIPPEDLMKEAMARPKFQGLPASFEEGQRCRRFWDPESDNDNGCTVVADGVRVYVPHDKPFMRWADIFGREFVEKYNSAKYAIICGDGIHYNRTRDEFWSRDGLGVWSRRSVGSLTRELKVAGYSATVPKGGTFSQVDEMLALLEKERPVDHVVEYLYGPEGVWRNNEGKILLNVSRVKVAEPADAPTAEASAPWQSPAVSRGFPFIHGLISHLFDYPVPGAADGDPSQVERFLWWLAVFYRSGFERVPVCGQSLFIAGRASQGKSFLAKHILPALMGSISADAGAHLLGQQRWTSDLASRPVLNVDDETGAASQQTRELFQNMIKRYVANGEMAFVQKYGDETTVPWFGRVIVTLNTDPRSMQLIPDLGVSNADKVTLLLTGGNSVYKGFGDFPYNQAKVREELAAFGRYLLDLEPLIPAQYRSVRFGVQEFHHPSLHNAAMASDVMGGLVEALAAAFKGLEPAGDEGKAFTGTATELYTLLAETVPPFVRCFPNVNRLGQELSRMMRKGWAVEKVPNPSGSRSIGYYRIPYNFLKLGEDGARARDAEEGWQK